MAHLHAGSVDTLPTVSTKSLLEEALARLSSDEVDIATLDRAYRSVPPDTLARQLAASCPPEPTAAVPLAEADPLDQVRFDGTTATSERPAVRAGDRYLDLGPMAGRLARLVGPEALPVFFDAYGVSAPDSRRLDFFLLLGEVLGSAGAVASAPTDAVL